MAGVVHVPWYATGFRHDDFADRLAGFAALAPRYGATGYSAYRSRDDRYKFLQTATFEHKLDWERYWEGEDGIAFRVNCSGWFQVPILYVWNDLLTPPEDQDITPEPDQVVLVESTVVEATIVTPPGA